jgi:hypothetical protein
MQFIGTVFRRVLTNSFHDGRVRNTMKVAATRPPSSNQINAKFCMKHGGPSSSTPLVTQVALS